MSEYHEEIFGVLKSGKLTSDFCLEITKKINKLPKYEAVVAFNGSQILSMCLKMGSCF
jgi:hypothetical protein